jgi:hypothetical protein
VARASLRASPSNLSCCDLTRALSDSIAWAGQAGLATGRSSPGRRPLMLATSGSRISSKRPAPGARCHRGGDFAERRSVIAWRKQLSASSVIKPTILACKQLSAGRSPVRPWWLRRHGRGPKRRDDRHGLEVEAAARAGDGARRAGRDRLAAPPRGSCVPLDPMDDYEERRPRDQGSAYFCDTVYYPILEATVGRPYALYVHGNSDTTGAVRGVETRRRSEVEAPARAAVDRRRGGRRCARGLLGWVPPLPHH